MDARSTQFTQVYRQALSLLAEGHWEEALAPFSSLARSRPADPGIQTGLGWCLLSTDRFREAEQAFRQVIRLEPGNVIAIVGLVTALLRTGDYFEASSQAERGLELEPGNPELRLARVAQPFARK